MIAKLFQKDTQVPTQQVDSINSIQQKIDKYFIHQIQELKKVRLPQQTYTDRIGGHLRHSYNFIENFLDQYQSGHINYEIRKRESRESNIIEISQDIGLEYLHNKIKRLTSEKLEDKLLYVTNDFGVTKSTTANELTSIASHTMHHFGIIGEILNSLKKQAPKQFGYAPSTIEYQLQKNKNIKNKE